VLVRTEGAVRANTKTSFPGVAAPGIFFILEFYFDKQFLFATGRCPRP
jgi:hypothetical protein